MGETIGPDANLDQIIDYRETLVIVHDPVIEAVQRAIDKCGFAGERLPMVAAVREVLQPIRDEFFRLRRHAENLSGEGSFEDARAAGIEESLDALSPFVYGRDKDA